MNFMEDNTAVVSRHRLRGKETDYFARQSFPVARTRRQTRPNSAGALLPSFRPVPDVRYTAFTGREIITHQRVRKFVSERNSLTVAVSVQYNYPPRSRASNTTFNSLPSGIFLREFDQVWDIFLVFREKRGGRCR